MNKTSYAFPPLEVRAQCIQVVNGFTVQLLLDLGFDHFKLVTLALNSIEASTTEQMSGHIEERERARELYKWLRDMLKPIMVTDAALLNDWPLRVRVSKVKPNASSILRPFDYQDYVVDIWVLDPVERKHEAERREIHINAQLVELGLATSFLSSASRM